MTENGPTFASRERLDGLTGHKAGERRIVGPGFRNSGHVVTCGSLNGCRQANSRPAHRVTPHVDSTLARAGPQDSGERLAIARRMREQTIQNGRFYLVSVYGH